MKKTKNEKDVRKYKDCKKAVQKQERQSYWTYINNIIEVGDPDSEQQPKQKRFWNSGFEIPISPRVNPLGKHGLGFKPYFGKVGNTGE